MSFDINITGIEAFGKHGIYQSEKNNAQKFLIDIFITLEKLSEDNIDNTINYENTWNAKNYLPEEINQQSIENFDYEEEEDNIDNYNIEIDDPEINEYLKEQNKLNKYVENCVNSFMANVSTKTEIFSLKNYILEKCKIVQNLKHLLLAGCLKDSTYYYEQIATLENSCCNDYNFKIKRSNMYVYLAAKYLTNFNSFENNEIYEKIKTLKPSARGEYEVTDLNNLYIEEGMCKNVTLSGWWIDAGTPERIIELESKLT